MQDIETGYLMGYHTHEEAGSRHLDAPLLRLDLAKEIAELKAGPAWSENGQNAKTLAKYPDLRIVLIALKRGIRLKAHSAKGRVSIHTLQGHVSLNLVEQKVDLPAGCLLELAKEVSHDVEALEESVILVNLAWHTPADGAVRSAAIERG